MGAQAGYLSPFLFILYWASLFYGGWRAAKHQDNSALFVVAFAFPVLFLFNSIASFNEILPHWPAMGYLVLAPLAVQMSSQLWNRGWFRYASYTAWIFGALLTVLVPLHAVTKLLPIQKFLPPQEAAKIQDGVPRPEVVDVTNELYGWSEVGKKVQEMVQVEPGNIPFVFGHRHYIASQLSFYVPGHPRIYCISERIDAYDFWQRDLAALDGKDGIFVVDNRFYTEPQKIYPFASWDKPVVVDVHRNGALIRRFWLLRGRNFNFKALPSEYTDKGVGALLTVKDGARKVDHFVFKWINCPPHSWVMDYFMESFSITGAGVPPIFLAGILLFLVRRENFWRELLLVTVIVALGGLLVQLLKEYFERGRPLLVFGDNVRVLGIHLYHNSFPSGHTQAGFSAATFVAMRLRNWKYTVLFFLFAACVGISRIYVGAHFPSDVVAGAIVGIVGTLLLMETLKWKPLDRYFNQQSN
jgi:undecaprenyl-diphosphatase